MFWLSLSFSPVCRGGDLRSYGFPQGISMEEVRSDKVARGFVASVRPALNFVSVTTEEFKLLKIANIALRDECDRVR